MKKKPNKHHVTAAPIVELSRDELQRTAAGDGFEGYYWLGPMGIIWGVMMNVTHGYPLYRQAPPTQA